jgi:hypothetical protein
MFQVNFLGEILIFLKKTILLVKVLEDEHFIETDRLSQTLKNVAKLLHTHYWLTAKRRKILAEHYAL